MAQATIVIGTGDQGNIRMDDASAPVVAVFRASPQGDLSQKGGDAITGFFRLRQDDDVS